MNKYEGKIASIKRSLLLTLLSAAFALGVFAGAGIGVFIPPGANKGEAVPEVTDETFRFIRASATSNSLGKNSKTKELKPFQYKVNALIENTLKSGDVSAVSVYFRDLNNGNWFGIREHDKFSPKSLLKVPLMIAYFKWAESNPLVLRKTLISTGKGQETGLRRDDQVKNLETGKAYSVNDLIFKMIAHDDAEAYGLLYANLPSSRLEKIFNDLYVEYDPHKQEDTLSLNPLPPSSRVFSTPPYPREKCRKRRFGIC